MDTKKIPLYCAWHPDFFGHELHMDGPVAEKGAPVSHGICRVCADRVKKEREDRRPAPMWDEP